MGSFSTVLMGKRDHQYPGIVLKEWRPMGNRGSMHGKRHGSVWQSGGEFTPASMADVDAREGLSLQTAEFAFPAPAEGASTFLMA